MEDLQQVGLLQGLNLLLHAAAREIRGQDLTEYNKC